MKKSKVPDWVQCLGPNCKTQINLNVGSPITGYCMECMELMETGELTTLKTNM